jgi:hypothetical protein
VTLEQDLNNMCASKKLHNPIEVSKVIATQVEIIENYPPAKIGKKTAEELLNFCKIRKDHWGEEYPYVKRTAEQYLSMYGMFKRMLRF